MISIAFVFGSLVFGAAVPIKASAQTENQTIAPQQLLFAGLRASSDANSPYAQFNAVQADASGNLYLLLDQKDGVRLLKTDSTATNILAQIQLGAAGDTGLAMTLDPAGNLYITGTSTSGSLSASSGAAFPGPSSGGTLSTFIGKFDQNLKEIFLTYAGSSDTSVTAIAATADAVFITGSIFGSMLPVTLSAIIQSPASGSFQNGFVEKFNSSGSALLYATYLSGQNGETAPAAIAADSNDNAYIGGYTTSSGFPTLAALVPNILSPTSGFLTKLTPGGDGLLFSTFIPGGDVSSIAIDSAAQNLLFSGAIALGQFPIAVVPAPLAATTYQSLLRLSLDGSTILSSTVLAPGLQSTLTPTTNSSVWVSANLTTPASLLPGKPFSSIGNSYALRVTQQNTVQPQIDQTVRFGGLPATNPNYASAPANITSLATDPTGQPIFAGSISPTASANLLAAETYDLPLYNDPTPVLPSAISAATLPSGACNGSLCAGSAAFLTKLNPTTAGPALALSTGNLPNLVLRNLGGAAASGLQLTATGFTLTSDCPATFPSGSECNLALVGPGPGTVTAQADNAASQSAALPATTSSANPIVFSPKELDFGIVTSTSPAATRTLTVTNLSPQPQTFASTIGSNEITPYTFAESSSDCSNSGLITTKTLAPGASCHITFSFTASSTPTDDGPAQSNWTIGLSANPGAVLFSAFTQAASLNLSAAEIDFGTQYTGGIQLPRYLYLSNNSSSPVSHTPVTLAPPFTLTDRCPTTLDPHTVCRLQLGYNSAISPSVDSTTLTLDDGITVLITGSTLPQPTGAGQSANPNLTLTPTSITFPSSVPVTSASSSAKTITIGNIGAQPLSLTLAITGDFSDSTDCPAVLPANSTCSVLITFSPTQPGTRQGLLSVTAGAGSSPAYVNLTGTGAPILAADNDTLSFGDVLVGQPTVLWYKITQPFSSLTASTSAPDFRTVLVEAPAAGRYGPGPVSTAAFLNTYTAACNNCYLGVQFTPSTANSQTATLTLTSSAGGSPSTLLLTGTGVPLTGLILTPAAQDFGAIPVHSSSAPVLFTLTNQTSATIQLSSPILTGDFTVSAIPAGGPACTCPLAPNASCFLNVIFAPTATGPRTGILTIPTSSTPLLATLTGFGSPDPGLALNPAALVFHNVPGPTATTQTVTLTNTGSATLQLGTPTTGTANFTAATVCTNLYLTPGTTCTINVTFTPADALTSDTLEIPVTSSTSGLTTYTVPLTGAYTTEDSGIQILPAQVNFGPNPTGTLGLTRQFTINNLTAKPLALTLSIPRQFVLSDPGSDPTLTCAALAPNASCTFSATFLPLTNGDITGTIFAQATPTDGSATLDGLTYLEGYGNGPGALSITGNFIPGQPLLNFGQVASGQSSRQTFTLTNASSSTPLTIRRLLSEWPFLITSTTCGSTLSPSQSCTATVTFTPIEPSGVSSTAPPGQYVGTLAVESDSLSSPDEVGMEGSSTVSTVSSDSFPLVSYALSTSSLTFSATGVGSTSAPQIVTLSNTGTVPIHITALQTTPDFTVQSGCTTLLPSASCVLYVSFTPQPLAANQTTSTTRISALEITSDASSALDFISLLGDALPAPLILTPVSLGFGSVEIGTTATLPLQVTNTTSIPLPFNSISINNSNYAAAGDCPASGSSLPAASSCTIQVSFTPTKTGVIPGGLNISAAYPALNIIAQLTGTGIQSNLVAIPASLNFNGIALGASANLTLTLANTGAAPITNLAFSLTGDYAITSPCPLTTLSPGASCTLTVTFTPTATGSRNAALILSSSNPNSPFSIPLTGTGLQGGSFLLTVDGAASATATVHSEDPAIYNLQITPLAGFSGAVVLNCTPIQPGQYATCSLLPSSITLTGGVQNAVATINTVTGVNTPSTSAHNRRNATSEPHPFSPTSSASSLSRTLLCLLPAALLWVRKRHSPRALSPILWTLLFTVCTLWLNGCGGSVVTPNLHYTPAGAYQYQITASSTTGIEQSQTVTLNLTVTAH